MLIKNDTHLYRIGFILFIISSALFITNDYTSNNTGGAFFVNFGISILYWIFLMYYRVSKSKFKNIFKPTGKDQLAFGLVFLTSCFSLNKEIQVFETSADWLVYYIILVYAAIWPILIFKNIPHVLKKAVYIGIGLSFPLIAYYSFYLLPFSGIGLIATIILGIGFHVFIPLVLVIGVIRYLLSEYKVDTSLLKFFLISAAIPTSISLAFIVMWNIESSKIEKLYDEANYDNYSLPNWIYVSQHLNYNTFEDTYLKQDILYPVHHLFTNSGFGLPRNSFSENQKHHPLVTLGQLFSKPSSISTTERLKLLLLNPENRHQSEEKLWNGDYLITDHIKTKVELIPEYHLAYTEKELWIKNTSYPDRWRGREQEALYTFQLPEGGIVTSLSLWINDIEEKSYLTTKSKADSAYKQIVGREVRDPSMVHWKEGNQVTVRVFPCTREEIRHFKLGVTSPLSLNKGQLIYNSISFEGPAANKAEEEFTVISNQPIKSDDVQLSKNDNKWTGKSPFNNYWSISLNDSPISSSPFIFNGKRITAKKHTNKLVEVKPSIIYLDLNSSWTENEIQQILNNSASKKMITFLNEKEISITEANYKGVLNQFKNLHFSLFPFHKINIEEHPLIISKSTEPGIQFSDLSVSQFFKKSKGYFSKKDELNLFSIGPLKSLYLSCLKDVSAFNFECGNIETLSKRLKTNQFLKNQESDNVIVLDDSKIQLHLDSTTLPNTTTTTDHLLRVFNFRQIMRSGASALFDKEEFINDHNMTFASEAYVVSPISSLIVLESQNDYDRFDIEKAENSLENAIISSKGAAPEPHEWCLILLLVMFSIYYINKNKNSWSWN